VRPCACNGAGETTAETKRNNNHKPARRMARLYRRQAKGTSLHSATERKMK
jgi:hypothetical protein